MGDLAYTNVYGKLMATGDTELLGDKTYITGNVGINIAEPLDMLDINGNIRLSGSIKTRASILELQNAGGSLVPVRASSLVLAPSTSYTAPAGGMYVHSRIGIGMSASESFRLDTAGDVRIGGQITVTQDSLKPPLVIASSMVVANLNADRLDGYEARDIFNSTIDSTGHGIIEGLTVTSVSASLSISISAGRFVVKDRGTMTHSTQTYSGFSPGSKHVVFIAGKSGNEGGKTNLVVGQIVVVESATDWPDTSVFTNPIIICRIDIPSGITAMSDAYIYADRTLLPIHTSNGMVNILKSDNPYVSAQSGGFVIHERVQIKKTGESTFLSISNVPNSASSNNKTKKTLELSQDNIRFIDEAVSKNVDASKIDLWDDTNTKKHVHIYDTPYVLTSSVEGNAIVTITSQAMVRKEGVRIYVNGLRKKQGYDFVFDQSDARILRFVHPISDTDDAIVIDYDV